MVCSKELVGERGFEPPTLGPEPVRRLVKPIELCGPQVIGIEQVAVT
jgi:hypothetical protein